MGRKKTDVTHAAVALLGAILFVGTDVQSQGVMPYGQEKADLEWRTLALPGEPDDHCAIYWEYTGGDSTDLNNHLVIEMLGPSSLLPGYGPNRIVADTLNTFVTASTYLGAYTLPKTSLTEEERTQIENEAISLRNRAIPIVYVNDPVTEYLDWTDNSCSAGTCSGVIESDDEINAMRSDAFAEYAYTTQGFPIVIINGYTIVTGPAIFISSAAARELYPSTQLAAMVPSNVDFPSISVNDQSGKTITPGSFTAARNVKVTVSDKTSGPGRLEVWQPPLVAGTRLGMNNDLPYQNTETRTYSSADGGLSVLGSLPPGQVTFRAYDQAGNRGDDFSFTIAGPPVLSLGNGNLYDGFSGVTSPSAAPSYLSVLPNDSVSFSVGDPAGLQSISISGPQGPIGAQYPLTGFPPGATSVGGQFAAAGPGAYSMTITDTLGNQTIAPFNQATLTATLDPQSRASYDSKTGNWTYSAILDINSSQGVDVVNQLNSTGTVVLAQMGVDQPTLESVRLQRFREFS